MAQGRSRFSDGKIIAAGFSGSIRVRSRHPGVDCDFALARYNPDGTLDGTFNGDGRLVTSFTPGDDEVLLAYPSIRTGQERRRAAGGWAREGIGADLALARFRANGALDSGFDGDGKVLTSFAPRLSWADDITLEPGGRILVATGLGLLRYHTDGGLDRGFAAASRRDGGLVGGGSYPAEREDPDCGREL